MEKIQKKSLEKMTKNELLEIVEKSKELLFYLDNHVPALKNNKAYIDYVKEIFQNVKE